MRQGRELARPLSRTQSDEVFPSGFNPIRLDPIAVSLIIAEDLAAHSLPGIPKRIGVNRTIPGQLLSASKGELWRTLQDGTRIWSVQIESPDAEAVRVHVSKLELPPGSSLLVGGSDGPAESYMMQDVPSEGGLWTTPIPGSIVWIEYRPSENDDQPPLIEIDEISHIYRGMSPSARPTPGSDANGSVASAQGLLSCHEDVSCWPVDETARDSVGRMIFTVPGQGSFICSGALLNDADPNTYAGYFLTANHCVDSQAVADTVVVYWFYESNGCGGSIPSLSSLPRSSGATLLATSNRNSGGNDSTLLRLADDPSQGQGFASWSTTNPSNGAIVHGIHHPGGSYKRYSQGYTTLLQPICGSLPTTRYIYNDWTNGVIEGGSSGSPLFNSNWQVIGQLFGVCYQSGTEPGCDNPQSYNNLYGKFSFTYPLISQYLSSIAPDDPYEDNDSIEQAAELPLGSHDLLLVDFDDYFVIHADGPASLAATANFDSTQVDLTLRLLDDSGAALDFAPPTTSPGSVSAVVDPGTYFIHASRSRGWGGPYRLEVQLTLDDCRAPTVHPDPSGIEKNRYLTVSPPDTSEPMAIRVTFNTIHVPNPPNELFALPLDFSALNGRSMWVGPPQEFVEVVFPKSMSNAAELQCEPHYMDWSGIDVINIFGPEVVPSSEYILEAVFEGCSPENEGNYSPPLIVRTSRWGDIAEPFQGPSPEPLSQPDIFDLSAAIVTLKEPAAGLTRSRVQLQPGLLNPNKPVSVIEIGHVANAAWGTAYPFHAAPRCP